MLKNKLPTTADQHSLKMQRYYQFQSRIYDATRWAFLFGRRRILKFLPHQEEDDLVILEVGCGTGSNLLRLANLFPNATLVGIDVSPDMLAITEKKLIGEEERLTLLQGYYGKIPLLQRPDIILFSYCLTMVNPGWDLLLREAANDLKPGGHILIADFHDSAVPAFKRHMSNHHVRMDGHLVPLLQELFVTNQIEIKKAYGGIWRFLCFSGVLRSARPLEEE